MDNCDTGVAISCEEIIIYHPASDWKSLASSPFLFSIIEFTCEAQGAPADPNDDTNSFNISVIGQNTANLWGTTINAMPYSGSYNQIHHLDGLPPSAMRSFTLNDQNDPICTITVSIDPNDCN